MFCSAITPMSSWEDLICPIESFGMESSVKALTSLRYAKNGFHLSWYHHREGLAGQHLIPHSDLSFSTPSVHITISFNSLLPTASVPQWCRIQEDISNSPRTPFHLTYNNTLLLFTSLVALEAWMPQILTWSSEQLCFTKLTMKEIRVEAIFSVSHLDYSYTEATGGTSPAPTVPVTMCLFSISIYL